MNNPNHLNPAPKTFFWLGVLLAGFIGLQTLLPLRTAVQIGADEGFELAKATLCVHGHKLYTEVWNDQPPLHTFLVTQLLKHVSLSVRGPRLVTSVFTLVLLASLFLIVRRVTGLLTAVLMTAMVIASPGFLELSASCMLEIPALATAMLALCVVVVAGRRRWCWSDALAGLIFGLALQMKLIDLVWTPLVALVVCLQRTGELSSSASASQISQPADVGEPARFLTVVRSLLAAAASRVCVGRLVIFSLTMIVTWVAVDFVIEGGAYLANFNQSWHSHFAAAKTYEFGSPAEHVFEWALLLRNWDTTLLALVGIGICVVGACRRQTLLLPLVWLAGALVVFTNHKPWWPYYYIHIAIPLCWGAALGVSAIATRLVNAFKDWKQNQGGKPAGEFRHVRKVLVVAALFVELTAFWMGGRVYLQIQGMRDLPQTFSSPVIAEAERYKPFARWLFTDELAYSFHTDIPIPPPLAIIPLKRLWSGEMTRDMMAMEMARFRPELVLLGNNASGVPLFQELLEKEYRLVYQDELHRLYASKLVIQQVDSR